MLELIKNIDKNLFLIINSSNNSIADFIFFWASNKLIWIPFYLWLLILLIQLYKKDTIKFLPVILMLITASDQLSVLIKNSTLRLRPCHEPTLQHIIHLVNNSCGGQYGFVSSHAANSMALAIFIGLLLNKNFKLIKYFLASFVILIGYSRIYLAAHYPFDVIGGWILGGLLGLIAYVIVSKKLITKT